ncbi:MAG: peptidoglycan editing factor PgeF [Armatimonadota bacterium]|nr:peptidoglycan editing factor PgeF [bacterium]
MRLPNWYRVETGGVKFYRAWNLQATGLVAHGFSTRIGGVSKAPYNSLNLGLAVNDDKEAVLANRRAFASAIGVDPKRIVVPKQIHSNLVKLVTESDAGSGALDHSNAIPDADALITNTPNLPLALHFADCVCIFLLDPEHRAIGVAHAGWRGTASKIVSSAIEAMTREFGSDPGAMLAAVGPAVARSCYDVGEDTAKALFDAFPHDERVIKQSTATKWRAGLKIANIIILRQAGLKESKIAFSESCTCCDRDEFFSYRREGLTGRMGGWMSLL